MAGSPRRTIIESDEFAEDRSRIEPIARRWDDFWFGFDWVLARSPEAGEQVFGLPYWMIVTEPSAGMPRLRILYEFDANTVTLLAVAIDSGVPVEWGVGS